MTAITYKYFLSLKNINNEDNEINNEINIELLNSNFKYIENELSSILKNNNNNNKHNNKWKHDKIHPKISSWRGEKPKFLNKDNKTELEIKKNEINSELNKISPKNFTKISQRLIEYVNFREKSKNNNDNTLLFFTIDNIFLKSVEQPIYCPYYVKLIKNFISISADVINIIKSKFNKYNVIIDENLNNNNTYNNAVTRENYDEFCNNVKKKAYKKGYSQFIGELYNNELITSDMVIENLNIIINNINLKIDEEPTSAFVEDNILCFCMIINTLSNKIVIIKPHMESINVIINKKGLPKRLKFMLMDLREIKSV